jgi:hypothetical protein
VNINPQSVSNVLWFHGILTVNDIQIKLAQQQIFCNVKDVETSLEILMKQKIVIKSDIEGYFKFRGGH